MEVNVVMRGRRAGHPAEPGRFGLARFAGAVLTEPAVFGGGAARATVTRRRDTVAYGYLAVLEQYESAESGAQWRLLTLTLPGGVPGLVVDHRSVLGQPGVVPTGTAGLQTGDAAFDAQYVVSAGDPTVVSRVLTPAVRQLLVGLPVQRFALDQRALSLRTFDVAPSAPDEDDRLAWLAGSILASAPSFVATPARLGPVGPGSPAMLPERDARGDAPLLPGMYGKDDREPTPEEVERARSGRIATALVVLLAALVLTAAIVVLVLI